MKVTIELDDDIIYAIANKKGVENGYTRLSEEGISDDLNAMYAAAFEDGMHYMLDLINQKSNNGESTTI